MSNHEAHPAYVALQDHADAIETELAAVKAELAEADAVIQRVRKLRDELPALIASLPGLGPDYAHGVEDTLADLNGVEGL